MEPLLRSSNNFYFQISTTARHKVQNEVAIATSHFKEVADCLGGTVKTTIWMFVHSRRGQTTFAEEFYKIATDKEYSHSH